MTSGSPTTMVPRIRTILGGFLFSGDDAYKKVGVLSGGERNRLALAKMLLNASNVLLLDEPTNHLDLDSKEVLLDALEDYGGTLVFVSHDRYFVDKLATKVIDVGGGQAFVYPGGYEDFLYWKKQREAGVAAPLPAAKPVIDDRPRSGPAPAPFAAPKAPIAKPQPRPAELVSETSSRAQSPVQKQQPKPQDPMAPRLRKPDAPPERVLREREAKKAKARIGELEKRIAEKEQAVKQLESKMAEPGFYDDRERAEKAAADHKSLMWEVGELMAQWEMLQESLQGLESAKA
jgi:ATP-binding cassette subfamily F protein 3